jgi:hypothetical protein
VPIMVGFWTVSEDDAQQRDALKETGADLVVTSLSRAVELVTMAKDTVPHEQMLIERTSEVPPAAE